MVDLRGIEVLLCYRESQFEEEGDCLFSAVTSLPTNQLTPAFFPQDSPNVWDGEAAETQTAYLKPA